MNVDIGKPTDSNVVPDDFHFDQGKYIEDLKYPLGIPLCTTQITLIWFRAAPKIEIIFIFSTIMTAYICQCGQKAELYCDTCCETTCEVCWFGNLHASHTSPGTPCIECGELSVFDCERCEASFCTNHTITHRSFQACATCGKITCDEMMADNSPDCFHCDWLKKHRAMTARR